MSDKPRAPGRSPRGAWVISAAATLSIVLFGCDDSGSLLVVRPLMVLEPEPGTRLDFGEVVLGRTSALPISIRVGNVGEGPLVLDAVAVEGDSAGAFRVTSHPRVVQSGKRGEIFVRFLPDRKIDAEAVLHIASNDPRRPSVTYPLGGVARDACALAIAPPHTTFLLGEVKKVTISNVSTQDCTITRLFTDQTVFPFIDLPELPFVIPAGSSADLKVQHVSISHQPGIPIRQMIAGESEGTEVVASFEGEPPVFGCLSVFPERLFFDETLSGTTARQRVTVSNRCGRAAFVTSAIITQGYYYYDVDEDSLPVEVAGLGSADVWVTYTPFNPLGDDGVLVLNTNDSANARFSIELHGNAAVPHVTYFPAVLDFGTVVFKNPQAPSGRSECSSSSEYVQLYSDGDADLVISRLEIDPAGDPLFEVTGVLVDGIPVADFTQPFTVGAGREAKISVHFFPTHDAPPEHRSTLLIHHNAESSPARVTLRGTGVADGAAQDVFTQLTGPKVDILWVIDDSCSMFDEQARLIDNLSQFVGYADSQNADYQMAVVTTDGHSRSSGRFEQCFPYPRVIAHDYADQFTREQAFRCLFSLGTNGSGREAGLAAAKNALARAIAPDQNPLSNPNAGFVREDAKLAVVIMSDEEDQSDEADVLLRDYFLSIKGFNRPDRMAVHAIAGPVAEACPTGPTQAQPGYRYYWMTQETNGLYQNICEEDWQPLLQSLGLNVFTPLDEWTLRQSADPASLVVTVGGVLVARSATNGFTYNPSANSVQFHGSAVPPPGATITIDYAGLCRP